MSELRCNCAVCEDERDGFQRRLALPSGGHLSDFDMARLRAAYATPEATSWSMYPDPNPFPHFRLFRWLP